MGLTCSLLGHAFEADGVEREREQRGDEVVTVVRETETCSRCGEQRVVSETTEVTSVLDRDETALDAGAGGEEAPAPDGDAGAPTSGALDGMVDRADADERGEVTRSEPDPSGGSPEEPTHPRVDPDEDYDPPGNPSEEDAEILGGGPDEDRDPGQWPDDGASTGTDAPSTDREGGDATDDPEVPDDAADAADAGTTGDATPPGGVDASGDAAGAGRFVCEECGFATPTAGSSLREGDSCPECNTGWLTAERGERNP